MSKRKDPLAKLDPREREYVANRVQKKMKKKHAALAAGYSEAMAEKASSKIENVNVREAFQSLMQQTVPYPHLCVRVREGVDATKKNGKADMRERREYIKLATAYGGYYVEKAELDVSGTIETECGERLARLLTLAASRANSVPESSRAAGTRGYIGVGSDNAEDS